MQRQQAFKYELRPNGEQQRQMQRFVGCCRFVFNKALALQKERYAQGQSKLSYADMCRQLTQWRHDKDTLWLALAPSQALQQSNQNTAVLEVLQFGADESRTFAGLHVQEFDDRKRLAVQLDAHPVLDISCGCHCIR